MGVVIDMKAVLSAPWNDGVLSMWGIATGVSSEQIDRFVFGSLLYGLSIYLGLAAT